jgi:LacI family transcriptional regulator
MATLKDIAEQAGISVVTVSRVLNGRNKEKWPCSLRRAQEIREIARKVNFRPNSAARMMRNGCFKQIGCVVARLFKGQMSRDFDNQYLETVTEEFAKLGYSVVFEPFFLDRTSLSLMEPPRLFTELLVDGILGIEEAGTDLSEIDKKLSNLEVPTVWVNRDPGPGVVSVVSDEFANGLMLARHFIKQGHRRIGYVGYGARHYSTLQRYQGVKTALEEAGLDTSALFIRKDQTPMIELVGRYVAEHRDITALICFNNTCYNAALHKAASLGLKVPGELTLGHFGFSQGSPGTFPMPVLEIPKVEMARTAVGVLLDLLGKNPAPKALNPIPGILHTFETGSDPGQKGIENA